MCGEIWEEIRVNFALSQTRGALSNLCSQSIG